MQGSLRYEEEDLGWESGLSLSGKVQAWNAHFDAFVVRTWEARSHVRRIKKGRNATAPLRHVKREFTYLSYLLSYLVTYLLAPRQTRVYLLT